MSEPQVRCSTCRINFTLEEGTRKGMLCPYCGDKLVLVDDAWIIDAAKRFESKNDLTAMQVIRVAELWIPAKNVVDEPAVRQFVSSLPIPVSLEYFGTGSRRVMLVRGTESDLQFIAGKLVSIWPSAYLKILDDDPTEECLTDNTTIRYNASVKLSDEEYLPLRTWETFLKGDPVHNILAATMGLQAEESIWLQFFLLRKGKPPWLADVQRRLKMEIQRGFVVNDDAMSVTGVTGVQATSPLNYRSGMIYMFVVVVGFVIVVLGLIKGWLISLLAMLVCIGIAYGVIKLLGPRQDRWFTADINLIKKKVIDQDAFYQVGIRGSVWAKNSERGVELMRRLLSSLSQYSLSGGNSLTMVDDKWPNWGAWPLGASGDENIWVWLGPDELSGFWHPPIVDEATSPGMMPVMAVEMRAPDPEDVSGSYHIGKYYRPDGKTEPVKISSRILKHNAFLIGKPGTGKTTLMEHLVLAGIEDEEFPAVVVVDPHGDMANKLRGSIPAKYADRIVVMDVGDDEYCLTINPLDVHTTGRSVSETTQAMVDIGESLWSKFWGPRMQIPYWYAVTTIAAANGQRSRGDALGLCILAELLTTSSEVRKKFIEKELADSPEKDIVTRYFYRDYKNLSAHMREQIIAPVLSKAYRFEQSPMLDLFSAPSSKLDLRDIIENRKILVINTRMSLHGAELSSFVGSMVINLLLREISRQGEIAADGRVPVLLAIDEFQTFSGVDWQELLAQLRKWGGRAIIGTQSLASLNKGDDKLTGIVMAGIYSLFAFSMNGEDAKYMSEYELSEKRGGPSAEMLTNLNPYCAYARILREDGSLARPFYFETDPPAPVDASQSENVWKRRSDYSVSRVIAQRDAKMQLSYMNRYGGTLLSSGSGNLNQQRGLDQASAAITKNARESVIQSNSPNSDRAGRWDGHFPDSILGEVTDKRSQDQPFNDEYIRNNPLMKEGRRSKAGVQEQNSEEENTLSELDTEKMNATLNKVFGKLVNTQDEHMRNNPLTDEGKSPENGTQAQTSEEETEKMNATLNKVFGELGNDQDE